MSGIMPASKMGFGCMRLPLLDPNDQTSIDLPQFKQMVDVFMEAGNTYFDTAFVYHEGASETALGEALVARYPRDSFTVATKCLAWALPNKEAAYNCLDVSLERMGLDYVDYYLLHNVGGKRTAKFDEYDMWNFAQEQKAAGKIKYVGFSIHDDWECLDKLLTAHPEMDFVQLQVNYLDWEDPHNEAKKLMEVAEKHGKPVIVMEPVKGGNLVKLPDDARAVLDALHGGSPASYAIRFAAGFPGMLMVLSGMSTPEQVQDNISFMKDFKPLDETELAAIAKVQEIFRSKNLIPCTGCRYCTDGCPKQIAIPELFATMNAKQIYHDWHTDYYYNAVYALPGHKASDCVKCGKCESVCPQHLPIRQLLENVAKEFEKKEA